MGIESIQRIFLRDKWYKINTGILHAVSLHVRIAITLTTSGQKFWRRIASPSIVSPLAERMDSSDLDPHIIHGSVGPLESAPNGISIGSGVFAGLTLVSNRRSYSVCSNNPHPVQFCRHCGVWYRPSPLSQPMNSLMETTGNSWATVRLVSIATHNYSD